MQKHDFYGLPRSIQDRFIESSQGAAAPVPLAVSTRGERRSLAWGLSSLACAGAWAAFFSFGFGDLNSSFALGSAFHKVLHIGFGCVTSLCAVRAYSLSWAASRLPYVTGSFLFPSGVIEANVGDLVEHDALKLKSVKSSGRTVSVEFSGASFQFKAESAELAKKAVEGLEQGAEKWKTLQDAEPLERARLNALTDSGVPNPLAPTQPHPRPQLLPPSLSMGLAIVLGVLLGFGISSWRDSMSQKALYKAAISANSVDSYRSYLRRGGDREEVEGLLLPRAELKEAVDSGGVEEIRAFFERNPDTKIGGEVQNALRGALLKELDQAKRKKTISSISQFEKKYNAHKKLVAGEITVAKRAVYASAMAEFQEKASEKDEALIPFVQQLLTHAELHGPEVQIRMSHVFKQDPAKLDKIVSKSKKYYMGRKSLPSQYFLGEPARRREKVVLEAVQKRLQAAFPKDVLEFKLAPPPQAENVEPAEIKVPTISLMHQEKLSGGFVGGRPKAMYMGATVILKAEANIPGSDQELSFTWSTWRSPTFSILSDSDKDIPDVYEQMLSGAYEKFTSAYLKRWFVGA